MLAAWLPLLTGCVEPEPAREPDRPEPPEPPGTVLPGAPELVGAPELAEVDDVPLSRLLTVRTDVPSFLVVDLQDEGGAGLRVRWPEAAVAHEVPLLGLKPGRRWWVSVWAVDAAGRSSPSHGLTVDTPPVPVEFPNVDVLAHEPDALEPGYRLFNVKLVDGPDWLVALDVIDLEIAWLYDGKKSIGDVRRTPEGTLFGFLGLPTEADMLMRPLRRWTPDPELPGDVLVPVEDADHELYPLDDGSVLTLAPGLATSPGYPRSYDEPEDRTRPADLDDDRVVRFAADGTLLWDWSLAERLDTGRLGFEGLDRLVTGYDWSHANGVIPHPDGGAIVSVRHQGALVRLDDAGAVVWILADPAGWAAPFDALLLAPVGDLTWPYHQHAPALDANGDLWVFDNHNEGHTPYTEPPPEGWWSRVVAFRVDEDARTVRQVAEWAPPQRLQSPALGDADPLPVTGNVLADFGFVDHEDGVENEALGRGHRAIRLIEADPAEPEPLLDLRLWTPADTEPKGVKAYRAEAIPSLYPPDLVVERL
jgi:hypothetical protein